MGFSTRPAGPLFVPRVRRTVARRRREICQHNTGSGSGVREFCSRQRPSRTGKRNEETIVVEIGPGYVPAFVAKEVLPNAPAAGGGVHRFLFNLARVLIPYRTTGSIERILCDYADKCGRRVPNVEIKAAIRAGQRYAWQPGTPRDRVAVDLPRSPAPPEPKFKPEVFNKFVGGCPHVHEEWLAKRSPICPWNRTPASFLHALYHEGESVVIFDDYKSQGQAHWIHRGFPYDARSLDAFTKGKPLGVWFLSNPVDGEYRPNDEGKVSRRSYQNVTAWRYMVVESDRMDISASQWLAAIVQLPLPVAAIYETGGRLPHALLRVDASSKERWDQIRDSLVPLLVMIGADPASLSAVRLSRLPCCERLGKQDEHGVYQNFEDGPHLQRLLYLHPQPDNTPITEQKVWPDSPPLSHDRR